MTIACNPARALVPEQQTWKTTNVQPTSRLERMPTERQQRLELRAPRRMVPALAIAAGVLLLAACDRREPPPRGESPRITEAKAAVARKLNTPQSAEYRQVVEYSDGVVCGEVNAKKMYSGTDIGFRRFIYNAPEPGGLVLESAPLPPQDIAYWCSEQPDKRLRMLAASVAELRQACAAGGSKASDMNCRLAETQKRTLDELQAATGRKAPAPGAESQVATAPAPAPAAPVAAAAPAAPTPPAPAAAPPVAAAPAAPAPAPAPAPAAGGNAEAAIVAEVGAALQTWRERWQEGDVDGYLRMYAPTFTGGTGSRAEWEQVRRQKMKDARPSIRVEGLKAVRITPQEVELRFVQVYAAKKHRDRGNKTMVFQRTPQGWLIADERWEAAS